MLFQRSLKYKLKAIHNVFATSSAIINAVSKIAKIQIESNSQLLQNPRLTIYAVSKIAKIQIESNSQQC